MGEKRSAERWAWVPVQPGWEGLYQVSDRGRLRLEHVHPAALAVEADDAFDQGEQGVVPAAADVPAGVVAGAALGDDDAAGLHRLSGVDLDPQPLALRVPAVADRALTFLVRHRSPLT